MKIKMLFPSVKSIPVWGDPHPRQLMRIAEYMNSIGFLGPTPTSTYHSINFIYTIDHDFEFHSSINRVYEDPIGVYNFQSFLALSSQSLASDVVAAGILSDAQDEINNSPIYLFSVGLQHLKWSAEIGSENPTWQVSRDPRYDNSAEKWIADWEKYASPIVRRISSRPCKIVLPRDQPNESVSPTR